MSSQPWVDFKAIKSAVSIEAVLSKYNVQTRRVNHSSLRAVCPLPTHTSKGAPSFCVSINKGAWSCKSESCVAARGGRSGGNVLDFVAIMEHCSVREAALKLAVWFGITQQGPGTPQNDATRKPKLVAEEKREAHATSMETAAEIENRPLSFTLKGIDSAHPYLLERGVPKEVADVFGIGFFAGRGSMANRIVIPIQNERGELIAYAGRSIDSSEPRYKLPPNFAKTREQFNVHRAIQPRSDIVIVVEGFFDAMRVHQAGYKNVVAL